MFYPGYMRHQNNHRTLNHLQLRDLHRLHDALVIRD